MAKNEMLIECFRAWLRSLPAMKRYGGRPAKGFVAAALIVLERLKERCELDPKSHLARGGAQIAGMTTAALRRILVQFGENRELSGEAGRTNRGNPAAVAELLDALRRGGIEGLPKEARIAALCEMQRELALMVEAYFRLEPIRFAYDASYAVQTMIHEILVEATRREQAAAVAQHLVGAKLAIRHKGLTIANNPSSAADLQSGRDGDFVAGRLVYHVTISPTKGHAEKCRKNVHAGLRPVLIVPNSELELGRLRVKDEGLTAQVAIESIESFVGLNVSEVGVEISGETPAAIGALLKEYNRRIDEAERDSALLIEIPKALLGPSDGE